MGRGKIEIKRIENTTNRQVTYTKRRQGIMKKASEISVLCDAKVSLIICGATGRMHAYCSPSTTLSQILEEYHKLSGRRLWDPEHEEIYNEIDRVKKENENMEIKLRHMNGDDITSLNHIELKTIEDGLENGLVCVRAKRAEYVKNLTQKLDFLETENNRLLYKLHQTGMMGMQGSVRDMDNEYHHQKLRDYSQMPFAFRVQPMQPNLQERI